MLRSAEWRKEASTNERMCGAEPTFFEQVSGDIISFVTCKKPVFIAYLQMIK